jgi:PAS domain S-box-containing protein
MFRSLVENSHAGIFLIDMTFYLTYANSRLAEILGYTVPEIVGSDFRRFLDEDSKKSVADRYIRRQRGEKLPSRYEFYFFHKNGQKRCAELSSAVYRDASGHVHTVGQMLDVTERKIAEEELKKAHAELEIRVQQRTSELQRANSLLQQEIEEHQKTQEALRLSESKYRHLIEKANSIILEMDPVGNVIFFNKFAQDFFGYPEDEMPGRSIVNRSVLAKNSRKRPRSYD